MTTRTPRLHEVTYRRLTPDDAVGVRDLHAALDERDGYYRFFGRRPKNFDHLAAVVTADDAAHCALGAFVHDRLIGVVNYVALEGDARRAEVAMVVAHEDQQSGIGTALLGHLADVARRRGVDRFVAEVLSTNSKMMQLLMDIDIPIIVRREDSTIQVDFDLSPATAASGPGPAATETDSAGHDASAGPVCEPGSSESTHERTVSKHR